MSALLGPSVRAAAPKAAIVQTRVEGRGTAAPSIAAVAPGTSVRFSARPAAGFVFAHWADGAGRPLATENDVPIIDYVVARDTTLIARFARNPFGRLAGTAQTLLRTFDFAEGSGDPVARTRGAAILSFTKTGAFTGRVIFEGESLVVRGTLNALGKAHLRARKSDGTNMRVEVMLDPEDPDGQVDVAVIGDGHCALGTTQLAGTTAPSPRQTITISQTDSPGDIGFLSLQRNATGFYRGIGALSDGSAFTVGGRVARDSFDGAPAFPIHTRLNQDLLSGLLGFETTTGSGTLQRRPMNAVVAAAAPSAAVAGVVFVAPDGLDTHDGTRGAPMRTLSAALGKLGGAGEIVMLAGDYVGERLDLSTARRLTIRSEAGRDVRILFGERVPGSAFTPHAPGIWKAPVNSIIPAQGTENRFWVFEMGNPEGILHPDKRNLQSVGRDLRLDHRRLWQMPSIDAVGFGLGLYHFENGILYLSTTTGEAPSPSQEFCIPAQTAGDSLVFNATPECDLTVRGIEVCFGYHNIDVSGARSYQLIDCKFFGGGGSGVLATNVSWGLEERCEYAANSNDGSSPTNGNPIPSRILVIDPWTHDNGDEGHSMHQVCQGTYLGGFYEYNVGGGVTPALGATLVGRRMTTRSNSMGVSLAVSPDVNGLLSGWRSQFDGDGLAQWTGGLASVVDSQILNPLRYGFAAVVPDARIHGFSTAVVGGRGYAGGAGRLATVNSTGRVPIQWPAESNSITYEFAGATYFAPRANQRLRPFRSISPNGTIEVQEVIDGTPAIVASESFTLFPNGTARVSGANRRAITLRFDVSTGILMGNFRDEPNPTLRRSFRGILNQATGTASGFVIGSGGTLRVNVRAQ